MNNIEIEIKNLIERFPKLKVKRQSKDIYINGIIDVDSIYYDEHIIDEYEVLIIIKESYPKDVPIIRETARRIPLKYGHIYRDGELCLATDEEVKIFFMHGFDLNLWVDNFVTPYLFGYSYYEKYRVLPFGERSHGKNGVIEFYKEFLTLDTDEEVNKFISAVVQKDYKYRGHALCPCGSKVKSRTCHKEILIKCEDSEIKSILKQSYINYFNRGM